MRITLWATLLVLLSACNFQKQEIHQVEPLTPEESRALQIALLRGLPLNDLDLNSVAEICEAPALVGQNVQGRVIVPEDYSKPHGRTIEVYYYGRLHAGKEPVVFYNGGPASDSHGSARILEDFFKNPQAQKLSFIYIDQRGTGCSSPFPTDPTPETVERLTHYTSTEIVRDSEVIREKLLGPKGRWKVFGQSYGALIVHRYAINAPESILGAYAHGFSLMKDQLEWLKLRIKSQKRVSELYFEKFPKDREALATLRSQIPDSQCFSDGNSQICGSQVLDALTIFLGFANNWDYLNFYIHRLLKADGTVDQNQLQDFVRTFVFGVYNNNGLAGSVISMSEISSGEPETETCPIIDQKLKAEGETPQDWLINECRLLGSLQNDQWKELLKGLKPQRQIHPEHLKVSLEKYPDLPFYLYSGVKDVFVPIETFHEQLSLIGNLITYRQFPNSGHEGFYAEPDVWSDLLKKH